jgi:hypothetical protein
VWRPQLILLEDHVADLLKHQYLLAAGYRIVRRYDNNGWYVPRESGAPTANIEAAQTACAT